MEKDIFNRSSTQILYRNISSLRMKELRKQCEDILEERKRKSDQRVLDHLNETLSESKDVEVGGASQDLCGANDNSDIGNENITESSLNSDVQESNVYENSVIAASVSSFPVTPTSDSTHTMAPSKFYPITKQSSGSEKVPAKKQKKNLKKTSSNSNKQSISFEDALSNCSRQSSKRSKKIFSNKVRSSENLEQIELKTDIPKINEAPPQTTPITEEVLTDLECGSVHTPPPLPSSLINLTALGKSKMWKEVKQEVKPVKRKFELNPPKPVPRPQPSFSIIKKVEPTFNGKLTIIPLTLIDELFS